MNTFELTHSLKTGDLAPVYLIYGSESFTRTEALRILRAAAEKRNADVVEPAPEGLEAEALLDDLRTPSLFAASRLVIVDGADSLISQSAELLLAYAEKPSRSATLALAAGTVDARRKNAKGLLAKSATVECSPVRAYEVPAWCVQRAKFHGKPLADLAAAKLLIDLAGVNLGQLDGRIQALAAYCRDKPRIRSEDVMDLVGGDHARTVWELARAVTSRKPSPALRAVDRLLREPRVKPHWIVASLARESRDISRTRRLYDEGQSAGDIAKRLGKPSWLMKRLLPVAQRADPKTLRRNGRLLLRADRDLKTRPSREEEWIVESLVLRLCKSGKGRAREKSLR